MNHIKSIVSLEEEEKYGFPCVISSNDLMLPSCVLSDVLEVIPLFSVCLRVFSQ